MASEAPCRYKTRQWFVLVKDLPLISTDPIRSVFLDEANSVKLDDFGLSKALAQARFANGYIGVRLYHRICLMGVDFSPPDTVLHVFRIHAGEA